MHRQVIIIAFMVYLLFQTALSKSDIERTIYECTIIILMSAVAVIAAIKDK